MTSDVPFTKTKKKVKNKIVVTPKLSSAKTTATIYVTVEFKKPINKEYRAYLEIKNVRVKGSSKIPVRTAKELAGMRKNCTDNRWTYYLTNDIDMTGKDTIDYNYADVNLDGKGHTITSDGPVFSTFCGKIKNVVFDCKYDCTISDKGNRLSKPLSESYFYLAPVQSLSVSSTMTNCVSKGYMRINVDEDMSDVNMTIAGLVGENDYTAKISRCASKVDIEVSGAKCGTVHIIYIGGLVNYNKNKAEISECEFAGSIKIAHQFECPAGICFHNDNVGMIYDCVNRGEVKRTVTGAIGYPCTGIVSAGSESIVERVLNVGSVDAALFGQIVDEDDLQYKQLPNYKYAYYQKSKSDGFSYRDPNHPFEVPGVTGVSDEDMTNQATFAGLDFEKVWKMGPSGPELKNLPAY